jgi:hypothetical protein
MTTIDPETDTVRRSRFDFASYGSDKRPIVVTIKANGSQGDLIELRLLRRRDSLSIDVSELYALLLRNKVMHARLAKARSRRKSVKRFIRLTN